MRTIIFPFADEFSQESEADKRRSEDGELIVLKSWPLDAKTHKVMDFDLHDLVRFFIGKVDPEETVRLVFGMTLFANQFEALAKPMPCRLEIVIKDVFNGDRIFLHDGKNLKSKQTKKGE